jgi:hypothetical protein
MSTWVGQQQGHLPLLLKLIQGRYIQVRWYLKVDLLPFAGT